LAILAPFETGDSNTTIGDIPPADPVALEAKIASLEATIRAKDAEIAGAKAEVEKLRSTPVARFDATVTEKIKDAFKKETEQREAVETELNETKEELQTQCSIADQLELEGLCQLLASTTHFTSMHSDKLKFREQTLQAAREVRRNADIAKQIVAQLIAPALADIQALRSREMSVDARYAELVRLSRHVSRLTQTLLGLAENAASRCEDIHDESCDSYDKRRMNEALERLRQENVPVEELELSAIPLAKKTPTTSRPVLLRFDNLYLAAESSEPGELVDVELYLAYREAVRIELRGVVEVNMAANAVS
jgi:hypothetical protein